MLRSVLQILYEAKCQNLRKLGRGSHSKGREKDWNWTWGLLMSMGWGGRYEGPPEVRGPKEGVLFLRYIILLLNMEPVPVRVSLKVEGDGGISDHALCENRCWTRRVIMCLVGPEEKQILVGWLYIEMKSTHPQTLRKVKLTKTSEETDKTSGKKESICRDRMGERK